MLSKASKTYQKLLKEKFLLVQCVQTSFLMATGDVVCQQLVEKRGFRKHSNARTAQFAFLGFCLVGPAVTAWYKLLARTFGYDKNAKSTLCKVACDQLIFAPGFLVIFISSVGLLHGLNAEQINDKLKKEHFEIVKTNWKIWPAVQVINFYFVPLKYQVLLVQAVAIFWNAYLSWMTQGGGDEKS
ncbi:unnamed protein product [Ceutorhynchus assimilis]|uniref:Mitochondrial inner membrane protein Mpv17 n=1 Tax=Ceutorhynchus assimilis TaxID=467358 RepID=A0A9N9MZT0_9CUCU|nr:unnamed protein product [Ceutorhynchus assimilis]